MNLKQLITVKRTINKFIRIQDKSLIIPDELHNKDSLYVRIVKKMDRNMPTIDPNSFRLLLW